MATPGQIGPYRISGIVGRRGAGMVYSALDPQSQEIRSIKVLDKILIPDEADAQRILTSLAKDIDNLKNMRQHGLLNVYGGGAMDSTVYVASDVYEGELLFEMILRKGRLSPEISIRYLSQIAAAVDYLHTRGVRHYRLAPSTVIIDRDNVAHTFDFGMATLVESDLQLDVADELLEACQSPEQLKNSEPGEATDVFAVGVLAFFCLTGKLPFEGERLGDVLLSIAQGRRTSLQQVAPELPLNADAVLERAFATEPARRFPSAQSLVANLALSLRVEHPITRLKDFTTQRTSKRQQNAAWKSMQGTENTASTGWSPGTEGREGDGPGQRAFGRSSESLLGRGHLRRSPTMLILGISSIAIGLLFVGFSLLRQKRVEVATVSSGAVATYPTRPASVASPVPVSAAAAPGEMSDSDLRSFILRGLGRDDDLSAAFKEALSRGLPNIEFLASLMLRSESADVRISTLSALRGRSEPELVRTVLRAIDDIEPQVRLAAARSLGSLPTIPADVREAFKARIPAETDENVKLELQAIVARH